MIISNFAPLYSRKLTHHILVSWLDHRGVTMSLFQTHVIDITLSQCGIARIASCGATLSATSNITCTGASANGIIGVIGMIIRGDATTSCKITCTSRNYFTALSDSFEIEIRAANLHVNMTALPSRLYLGSPFSISCAYCSLCFCIFLIILQMNFKMTRIQN